MHVGLIANTAWLDEELATLRALVVGLVDQEVRVTQIMPESLPADETLSLGGRINWQDASWSVLRRWNLTRWTAKIGGLNLDLLHALDGRVWDGTLALARRLDVPAVLTAWSMLDVPLVSRLREKYPEVRLALAATTTPLAQAIRQALPADTIVAHLPLGVRPPNQPHLGSTGDQILCGVISGDGHCDADYRALLEALGRVIPQQPQAQFFLDNQGADSHQLWREARKLNLLSHVSMIPRKLGHREFLFGADALIHPQPLGRARSLTLQAMARGMPVLARQDEWLDYLQHDQTAWIVPETAPRHWEELLLRLLDQSGPGRDLGRRAAQYVQEHHSPARLVAATAELYQQMLQPQLKFPQPHDKP